LADKFVFVELPRYIDQDAFTCVLKMMNEGLSQAQILILANSSSRSNVEDAIASQSGVLDAVVSRYAADPLIDSVELKRRDISAKLGANAAERLMNVDLNPLSPLKQQRQQIIEMTTMIDGAMVPVDPTDDDAAHLAVIMDRVAPMIQNPDVMPLASTAKILKPIVDHADAHVQSAIQKGAKPNTLSEATKAIAQARKMLQLQPLDTQAQAAIAPALAPGTAPAPSVATDAGSMEQPPAANAPQQTISNVANPERPQPPR
jgi:hypothetical protein